MSASPPNTPRQDLVETLHGVAVADPYRWLEEGDSAEVRTWTEAQSRHTRAFLDALPDRGALHERLRALLGIGTLTPPAPCRGRYFHVRRVGDQEQPILYVRESLHGDDRVLVDATAGGDATTALDWWYPSADGRLLAYGLSESGDERSTLRVMDVGTGEPLADVIPFTRACSLAWLPDASGFYYTRYPEPGSVPEGEEGYHRRVYRHRLGDDWRDDPLVFPLEPRPPEDWPNVSLSPEGTLLAVSVSRGWTRTDVYLARAGDDPRFVAVSEDVEALHGVLLRDDRLCLLTNREAPRFRLVEIDLEDPGNAEAWRDVIPESDDVLETAALVRDRILAVWLREASSRLTLHEARGSLVREIALPTLGSAGSLTGEWNGDEAFFGFDSYAVPPCAWRVSLDDGECTLWDRVAADISADAFEVSLEHCTSRDGTIVSLFVVRRRDRPADGTGPALLYGYGGFNISLTPSFGRSALAFLERGGLFAVAHLRGGGEYGEDWHRAGMLERKQNVFDDAAAAAEHLMARGHVAPDRLAIMGGSNGGLLVGALITQRPELFRAAVCQVPLLDMLRYHRFRIARLWVPEYGSADDPDAFAWLHAYSPYHRVREDVRYPATLITTGESDSRVDPMHARKMAAALQRAVVESGGGPILLRAETRAGHGQGKPTSRVLEEWTDTWSFLFAQLGV